MTAWTPEYRVLINGTDATDLTLVGFTATSGRTDVNTQAQAGYCNLQLINATNAFYDWSVNTGVTLEVKDTSGNWVSLFGGRISDVSTSVRTAGEVAYVTQIQIVALGALSKLSKAIWTSSLAQDDDGDQIFTILSDLLLASWNEISPAQQWSSFDPTTTWANAGDVGLGDIDRPGQYEMEQRSASPIDYYSIVTQIANSALGYIYENANGEIGYADAAHRQTYLLANGYTELDAREAFAAGIKQSIRSGKIINKYQINYGNNFNSSKSATDQDSIDLYGLYSVQENSLVHDATDAQNIVNRQVALRAYPRPLFDTITFPLQNPEMTDGDRDALINVFMGQPVKITNLPINIYGGEFTGYIEGWTWTSTLNGLSLTFTASPTEFSAVAQNWDQVNAAETWNTILNTLEWQDAIGVIS
jgi:hypothetical protein